LLTSVAKRNGLKPAINPTLAAVLVDHLDQTNESDINLVNRLGKHHGAIATVKAGRLLFAPAGEGKTASGTAIAPVVINRNQGDGHTYSLTDRDSEYTGVQANWNEKKHATLKHEIAGTAGNLKTLRHTYQNQKEAQTAAANAWRTMQYQTASLTLTLAQGNAALYPETPAIVRGFKKEIEDTRWNIARLVHSMGDSGFMTEVECEALG
jgi:phage protein D